MSNCEKLIKSVSMSIKWSFSKILMNLNNKNFNESMKR